MIRALEIRALRLALTACVVVGSYADWLAPRIAQRLKAKAGGRP